MTDALARYFQDYADAAINRVHQGKLAINFYKEAIKRLEAGIDISDSIPEIKRVGSNIALDEAKAALDEHENKVAHTWDLPKILSSILTTRISQHKDHLENLPRYEVTHKFILEAGTVIVTITTANRNVKITIDAGSNPMRAQAACYELEKQLSYVALSS